MENAQHATINFFGEMPGFAHNLHTVGEVSTVKIKMDTTPNWWAVVCIVCLLGTP